MPQLRQSDSKGWRRARRFERAAVNLSWKGSVHPDDYGHIEREYQEAAAALREHLNNQAQQIARLKEGK